MNWRPQDRIPWGSESSEWNDAENRKQEAIRKLEAFGRLHPEWKYATDSRVFMLKHSIPNDWPLGTRL